jgi:hypothetical protein
LLVIVWARSPGPGRNQRFLREAESIILNSSELPDEVFAQ